VDKLPIEAFVAYITTGQLPDDLQEQIDMLRAMATEQANNDAALTADALAKGAAQGMSIEYDPVTGRPTRLVPAAGTKKALPAGGPSGDGVDVTGVGGPGMGSR
jgi:hypothetical protein